MSRRYAKIYILVTIAFVGLFLVYTSANAAGLVPCGRSSGTTEEMRPCTTCDIFALINRIMNFVLSTIVPIFATLLYLLAGFLILLSRGNAGAVSRGKNIFWNTTWAMVIIFGAYMITNTIIKSIAGDSDFSKSWFRIECTATVQGPISSTKYGCNSQGQCVADANGTFSTADCGGANCKGVQPATSDKPGGSKQPQPELSYTCDNGQCVEDEEGEYDNVNCDGDCQPTAKHYTCDNGQCVEDSEGEFTDSSCDSLCQEEVPTTVPTTSSPPSAGAQCKYSGVNLCEPSALKCSTSTCGQYSDAIIRAAGTISISGVNATALIRSIMFNESTCNVKAKTSTSCGLMQLQPSTANIFKSRCGVKENISCDWLTNPINASASVCIGAQYLQAIGGGTCGTQIRSIAAGYNGGEKACQTSVSCSGEKSCSGDPVRKWECLYDNNQHTQCNTGYNETRAYAPKVLACYKTQ